MVRLFTSVAGSYPVGTRVRLSGGQLGVVMDVPSDAAQATRLRVKVIQGAGRMKADSVVDLAEPGLRPNIVASLDSTETSRASSSPEGHGAAGGGRIPPVWTGAPASDSMHVVPTKDGERG
ncbi:hypothetical protein LXT21_10110 [Myxococcus sp. K38C18041901]|uniref:hypothetical protein n=1 Tax=Myxococcus guangdongensis TaxID=2906760 RepID=UPI0020A7D1F6|nr:hypothetical protein [Myxococcus guangdongensis]MCP3059124.1 hypothetical protein [Myxococcus guangdongensis]